MNSSVPRIPFIAAFLLVAALLVSACSSTAPTTPAPVTTPPSPTPTPVVTPPAPTPTPVVTPPTPTPTPTPVVTPPAPTPEPTGITASELAAHNSRTDCWVGYKGEVYDVTSFLPQHPGGVSAISRYCGTADEFTVAFNRQHRTREDSRLAREAENMGALA